MQCQFAIEVFRFDAKVDYLPYYKKITLKIDAKKRVADLLALIKRDDSSFEYPVGDNAAIKINGKLLFTSYKIEDIGEFFGCDLKLEPLNSKRSVKDLAINRQDFEEKFDLLSDFVCPSDREVFRSYIREHYASPIINLEEDFLGDGLFSFAYDMMQKYPKKRVEILKVVAKKESGVWLHVNISNRLYPMKIELEKKVIYLKNKIINEKSIVDSFIKKQRKKREAYDV